MNRVVTAIEAGRCVLAVSGGLLRDPNVALALRDRAHGLPAIALSGAAVAPVVAPSEAALARVTSGPGGVLVLVAPESSDLPGLKQIANVLKGAAHKPTILVATQKYDLFMMASTFPGIAAAHLKARGSDFITALPMPPAAPAPTAEGAPKAPKAGGPDAPRFVFVGREEEQAALVGLLGEPGPIVISGAAGIGKTQLVEHAVAASGLARLPDLVLGWGVGYDTLIARLAEITKAAGQPGLFDALAGRAAPGAAITAAIAALQAADDTAGKVMVVHDLHHALGRDEGFFRKSRLEMLLEALLTNSYPLRLVFTSRTQPVFFRERAQNALRRVELKGIKGRFFHEIFEAYKAPEFPRDKFGPLSEKVLGHPMIARAYAIEVRDRKDGLDLVEDPKFLKMESLDDLAPVKKLIEHNVEKLDREEREALLLVAHFRLPVGGQMLSDLGIGRKQRVRLLSDGLLEVVGTPEEKRYHVHSLVRSALSIRETSDYDVLKKVSQLYERMANSSSGVEKLAYAQESNRNAILSREMPRLKLDLPDDDAWLEAVAGLIRGKKPQFDVAARLLRDVLKGNPTNADAHLLRLEGMQRTEANKDDIQASIDDAAEKAPVPELFHQATSWLLARKARGKAATLLEKGIAALPDQSRLRTRLAALLLRLGRRPQAIEQLQAAMELDPMLPDAYGLLGNARRDEGITKLDEAEQLLREAVRLAPGDATQIARLVDLQLSRARIEDGEKAAKLREEAKELLDRVIRSERRTPDAYLLFATAVREEGGDLERAAWLIKKAKKLTERGHERNARIVLESASIAAAQGDLDGAEKDLRDLAQRDPSNARVVGALASVLEKKQLYIPAHAELQRARQRVPESSIDAVWFERELARLQAFIEQQVALYGGLPGAIVEEAPAPAHVPTPIKDKTVRRRRHADGTPAAPAAEGAPAEAHEDDDGDDVDNASLLGEVGGDASNDDEA